MDDTLKIFEIFKSIQGESSAAGKVCFFIRLAGCDLNCRWCDTPDALPRDSGNETTLESLVETALASGAGMVEITGGEPLLQEATPELCRRLLDAGMEVLLETNGTEDISIIPPGVRVVMDCKCPSSGAERKTNPANFAEIKTKDELKFAILDHGDYRYASSLIEARGLADKAGEISFSPVVLPNGEGCDPAELAEWMIRDNATATLRPQLHKLIWPDGEPKTFLND
jgi:7-carboxy-7-deazaguanine synthase